MVKYLFATFPVTGHVNRGLPIARALITRGHDVRWYSAPRFRAAIEAIGARWVPYTHATRNGVEFLPGMLIDLEEELDRERADVLVGDHASAVCSVMQERRGIAWAVYGVTPLAATQKEMIGLDARRVGAETLQQRAGAESPAQTA